jgi:hypothetical protein
LNQAQPQIADWNSGADADTAFVSDSPAVAPAQVQAQAPAPAYCDGAGAGAGAGAADIDITEDLMTADLDPELLEDFELLQLGSNLKRESSIRSRSGCRSTCKLVHVSGLHFATGVLVNGSSLVDGLPRLCILTSLVSAPC